jgi:hypothetical protein
MCVICRYLDKDIMKASDARRALREILVNLPEEHVKEVEGKIAEKELAEDMVGG